MIGINRVGELLIAIFLLQVLKIARRVIAVAIADMRARHVDLHANGSPAAIVLYVRAEIVADQVVTAVILLDLGERIAQIAQIEKGLSARVRGKSRERVARILALVGLMKYGRAGEHRSAGRGVRRGVAARRRGQQPARIDRINGDVGAIRGVRRGAQLRAIFLARLRDAAGEFDQRFPSGNSAQHVRKTFDGRELLVRIEYVEFGFVGV